ncbi:hypothetical protein ARMGADRAFT_1040118 [Armillaria gallica]|uniref:Uncharacterized protein n=1 Tax=Armillaria gallica TaxID=47427 RepID=A0A2H3CBE0_ARMGA|nr:hypothetical protein ARMGADRAFT_1040118 [Armillaria gallica]
MPHATDIIAKGLEKLADFQFFAYTFAVIHPAYKLQWFQKNLPGEVLEVKNLFINTLWKYKSTPDLQTPVLQTTSNSGNLLLHARNILCLDNHANASGSEPWHSLDDEVERYLSDPVRGDVSILMFWQLGADSMEALQMLKYSVRKGWGLNFTEGTDEMSEIHELELLIEQQISIPEDMQAFIKGLVLENGNNAF